MTERMTSRGVLLAICCALASGCGDPVNPQTCTKEPCTDGMPPSPCSNGVLDGDETDVDCGGPMCHACAGGRHCSAASDCLSGNCVADTGGTCYSLVTVTFADPVTYPSGFKPYVMLSGDLDGDGYIDLAAGNEEASAVAVFRNSGTGTFAKVSAPTSDGFPTGEYPTGGAIVDLDRDGVLDVITSDYHGNSVSVLRGQGTGNAYTLDPYVSYPTQAGAETSNLAIGDLNGDGIMDVIATNPQTHSISVFLGRGNATFGTSTAIALSTPDYGPAQPYSVAIGDFDGDGANDAAIADDRSSKMLIELGNGDGTFRSGTTPNINGVLDFIVIARDMNGDGKLDLVVANRNSDDVSVLLGHGDGTFADGVAASTGMGTGPYTVAVADFNLDGALDIVTANFMTGNASVLLGNGDGTFQASIDAGATGQFSYGVTVGDFDGDGKPDFATANAVSNNISVKINTAH